DLNRAGDFLRERLVGDARHAVEHQVQRSAQREKIFAQRDRLVKQVVDGRWIRLPEYRAALREGVRAPGIAVLAKHGKSPARQDDTVWTVEQNIGPLILGNVLPGCADGE